MRRGWPSMQAGVCGSGGPRTHSPTALLPFTHPLAEAMLKRPAGNKPLPVSAGPVGGGGGMSGRELG